MPEAVLTPAPESTNSRRWRRTKSRSASTSARSPTQGRFATDATTGAQFRTFCHGMAQRRRWTSADVHRSWLAEIGVEQVIDQGVILRSRTGVSDAGHDDELLV